MLLALWIVWHTVAAPAHAAGGRIFTYCDMPFRAKPKPVDVTQVEQYLAKAEPELTEFLGFEPLVAIPKPESPEEMRQIEIWSPDEELVAHLEFTLDGDTMVIGEVEVEEKFRERALARSGGGKGTGLNSYLLGIALLNWPRTNRIALTWFSGTNHDVVHDALQGKNFLDPQAQLKAIQETPAYKVRAKFGFTDVVSINIKTGRFDVIRPPGPR